MDMRLPPLGEGADSGAVVNVFVKPGDTVAAGQPVLELESEKAIATVPADRAGTVGKVFVKAGDKLAVGQRILEWAGTETESGPTAVEVPPQQAAAPPAPPAAARQLAATPEPVTGAPEEEETIPEPVAAPVASPSVRRLARELGIDLRKVRGTDPGGRITRNDLRSYIARLEQLARKPRPTARSPAAGAEPPKPPPEAVDFAKWGPVTRQPLSQLRQVIARRMSESWRAIARVTQFDEADFTRVNELRKQFAPAYEARGVRLTVTPFVVRALVDTLRRHPVFNSSLDEAAQELVLKQYYHIGIAVDTEQGLLVPVVRDVEKKSLLDLARELETLAQRARERKVSREEMQGGTFTLSNQGAIGGGHFTPIVNRPEVGILGLGRGALKPVVRGEQILPRLMVPLALSYDHRVIDGGSAARFMVDLVRALEEFPAEAVAL